MFETIAYAAAIAMTVASANEATELTEPTEPQVVRGTRVPLSRSNSIYGPTGLIEVPTAYSTPVREAQFSATFANELRGPALNYGIVPSIEIGGAFIDREGADNKLIGNAKVTIVPQNFDFFEVGVGVIDVADAIGRSWYVVGSADFAVPGVLEGDAVGFRVHGGVGTGIFQERLIAGAELTLDPRFSIIGEWDARKFNGALRYVHDDSFRIQAGFHHTQLFLGATYILRFGSR